MMFDLFKPKKACSELGYLLASTMPKMFDVGSNPGLDREFELYVENGASAEHIRPEMAALQCFCAWAGLAVALQTRKITQDQFALIDQSFFANLEEFSQKFDVVSTGSVSYDSFWDWLKARLDRYMHILDVTNDTFTATRNIVQNFCDFACPSPSETVQIKVWQTYEASLLNVTKIMSMHRLTLN